MKNTAPVKVIPAATDILINDKSFLTVIDNFKISTIFKQTVWDGTALQATLNKYVLTDDQLLLTYTNQFNLADTLKYNVTSDKIVYESHHLPSVTTPSIIIGEIGTSYTTADGITVTINSFTTRKDDSGYDIYVVSNTLKNNTDKKIVEGTFALLFQDKAGSATQLDPLKSLLPSESITQPIVFEDLSNARFSFLQYVPSPASMLNNTNINYWKVPAVK